MTTHLGLAYVGNRCEYGYAPIQQDRFCQCPQVPAAKADGIARANRGADDLTKARIDKAIRTKAASGQPFTVNDLRFELAGISGPVVGGRFNAAQNAGVIVPTGRRIPSNLASTHGHGVIEWRAAS